MNEENQEELLLKQRILNQNTTFKTAFKATLGFYAAQTVASLIGLVTFGTLLVLAYVAYKLLK